MRVRGTYRERLGMWLRDHDPMTPDQMRWEDDGGPCWPTPGLIYSAKKPVEWPREDASSWPTDGLGSRVLDF